MAVNRFYKGTPYQASLYVPPVDFIAKALEAAQKQYDVNYNLAENIKSKYIESRVQDRPQANALQEKYASRVNEIAAKYNQDYSQASKDLTSLTRELDKDFKPGGQAYAIQTAYTNQEASLKAAREGKAKGIYSGDQVMLLQDYYAKQAPVSFDDSTKTWSTLQPFELPEYVDYEKAVQDIAAKTPEREVEYSGLTGKNSITGYLTFETRKEKGKDPNEMGNAFEWMVRNDGKSYAYVNGMSALLGISAEDYAQGIVDTAKTNLIPNYSGKTVDSRKYDYKEDYRYRLGLEDQYQRNRILFKHNLENPPEGLGTARFVLQAPEGKQYGKIDKERTVGALIAKTGNPFDAFNTAKEKTTYQYLMGLNDDAVNKPMLVSIKRDNPNFTDSQIIDKYNEIVGKDQSYSDVSYIPFNTSSAMEEEIRRTVPLLKTGSVKVTAIDATGKKRQLTQEQVIALGNAAVNDKGKLTMSGLGKSLSYSGHAPGMATMLSSSDGTTYFVENQRYDIANVYESLNEGFRFMRENKPLGTPIPYRDKQTGGISYMVGSRLYYDGYKHDLFFPAKNVNGKWELDQNNPFTREDGTYASAADIEMMLVGDETIRSILPRKSKGEFEAETGTFLNGQ